MKRPPRQRALEGVAFGDSLWLVAALLAAVAPMAGEVGLPVAALFAACALLHLRAGWVGHVLPGWGRWVVLAAGVASVYLVHGSFSGMEPGTALFLILFGVKLLELRTRREYQVACSLGYFSILCGLFFSQEFLLCLYEAAVFFGFTVTLRRFHSTALAAGDPQTLRERAAQWGPLLRASGLALVQAAPVVFLLFCFFPRVPQGFGLNFLRRNLTGMSDHLSPGVVEELVENDAPAFRVRFVRGSPGRPPFYWRGLVLWECDGLEWKRGNWQGAAAPVRERSVNGLVEQEIVIEPHGGRWLFALDVPVSAPPGSTLHEGRYITSRRTVDYRQLYHALSGPVRERPNRPLLADATEVSGKAVPRRVRELAESWKGTPQEKVRTAVRFFAGEGFSYTLASGALSGNGWEMLDTFLFERKKGYCSHYAAAFASLMRLSGVPARVVMGYAGGSYNPMGDFYLVSQADAHAWCEVWLEEEGGWVRVDPTAFVPGGRGGASGQHSTADPATSLNEAAPLIVQEAGQAGFFGEAALRWAAFNYDWTVWMLGYDREMQQEFFDSLGLGRWSRGVVFLWAVGVAAVFVVALRYLLKWSGKSRPAPLARAYLGLCRKLGRVGLERRPAEPPAAFFERAAAARPDLRPVLEPLFARYIELAYAPWKIAEPALAVRELGRSIRALTLAPAPGAGTPAASPPPTGGRRA